MWDPISIFYMMWVLNVNLPEARLNVLDVVEAKEKQIIDRSISDTVTVRTGIDN